VFLAGVPFFEHVKVALFAPRVIHNHYINSPRENVWTDLRIDEVASLSKYLFSRPELNLTKTSKATG
jgi:hypothetical protein